jgi:hypothetical protein
MVKSFPKGHLEERGRKTSLGHGSLWDVHARGNADEPGLN